MCSHNKGKKQTFPEQTARNVDIELLTWLCRLFVKEYDFSAGIGSAIITFRLRKAALLPFQYPLDFVQFVECLKRGEVVHVEVEQFVAYLFQDGVVELEETEL